MQNTQKDQAVSGQAERKQHIRLLSLDAFRGFTILGMLIVNNLALDTYTPRILMHADWSGGITFADMVFPWFLFIVGVAIPYSAASHKAKNLEPWKYDLKVIRRTIWLIALGFLVDSSIAQKPTFELGIGLAYMVGALLYNLKLHIRIALAAALLLIYWAMIRFIPIPGAGAGHFTENQNLIKHINEAYLKPYHLKGAFSTIPTSALVIIGSIFGDITQMKNWSAKHKTIWIIGCGIGLALIGFIWSLDLPFNKPVWTPSYILFSAGLGALVMGVFFAITDYAGVKKWAFPLVVFGSNAILAYVLPIITKAFILQSWTVPPTKLTIQQYLLNLLKSYAGPIAGGWLYTLIYIALWWIVLLQLYKNKIFLRI